MITPLERARQFYVSFEAAIHPAMRECFLKCLEHLIRTERIDTLNSALDGDDLQDVLKEVLGR